MTWDDEATPLQIPDDKLEIVALRHQIGEMRKEFELWRPIVGSAKILTERWKASAGDFDESIAEAIDIVFRMVTEAEAKKRGVDV